MTAFLPLRADYLGRARKLRERQHAEVQAGLWRGASPVRRLSPEEIAAYERELRERDRTRGPAWTTPMPGAQPAPEPKPEPKEEPVESLERARSLRAELEQIEKDRDEKRKEALRIADELEQEARALRSIAGAVPVRVVAPSPPPPPKVRKREAAKRAPRSSRMKQILDAMPIGEPVRARAISDATGLPIKQVSSVLNRLAFKGLIESVAIGLYRRTR